MFVAVLFVVCKLRKQLRCPSSDEWIKKNECYSATKKNKIMSFAEK
jgi:hypothetical protein